MPPNIRKNGTQSRKLTSVEQPRLRLPLAPGQPNRYSKLSDALERKICDLIEHGAPYESACQQCGIARRTLYNWRTAGTAKPDGRYGRFLAAIKNALRKKKRADVAEAERRINAMNRARRLRRFKTL
jgi:hypothetical protein